MRQVEFPVLPGQRAFLQDLGSKISALLGGYGAGKTEGGCLWLVDRGFRNWPAAGLYVGPTYPMVRDIAVRTFRDMFERMELPYEWHRTDHIFTFRSRGREHEVYMRSGDKPERIIGFNAGHALLDEPGQMDAEVYDRVLARVRDPRSKVRQIGLTGTPEGFNWLHDVLVAKRQDGTSVVKAKTTDNPFLPPDYVQTLLARYPEALVRQYLEGEFVRLEGNVYEFSRERHARPCANPMEGELVLGADFNVGKMCWVLGRILGDELHIWGEIVRENTNTFEQTDEAVRVFCDMAREHLHLDIGWGFPKERLIGQVKAYVDASGKARKTSATESDHQIMRRGGFQVTPHPSNPPVRDRVYSVNEKLRTGRLFVDADRCPHLAKSLEQQGWNANGEPEKHPDPKHDLSGPVDALGYLVHFRWPTSAPRGNRTSYQRH